jgi:DNA helicase-2/ATP-dependent DNA helicase PcrA
VASVDPNNEEVPKDAVTLMTIHRCKGLEYRSVHLTNASEGMLPHCMAIRDDDADKRREGIEEERRLAFVAMSRSKERLTCWYYTKDDQGRETTKSRYLTEAGL